jgi:hypothetical protein
VSLTAPAAGATVAGTINVTAGVADNVGVAGVQFKYNGANLGAEVTAPPYTVAANTTTIPNGQHTLTAVARDAAGNQTTSSPVAINVQNGAGAPPPDGGAVQWSCEFATAVSCGFAEQAKVPGRATVVSPGRNGGTALRLHTEPGDNNVAGSGDAERNDLTMSQAATNCYHGVEQWWAHSILFPSDYVDPPESGVGTWNYGVVFDFHNANPGAGQANFQINAMPVTAIAPDRPTGLSFSVAYGNQFSPTTFNQPIGPVVRNVWYDFVYHVKWSAGADGFITAWVNGVKKMTYTGPTLYPDQGCYLKLANYHSAFGLPSSVIHDRVIRGTSAGAVSLTPLQ